MPGRRAQRAPGIAERCYPSAELVRGHESASQALLSWWGQ
ncbi:hypothetical protein HMPREF0591_0795 [Mycobacterium parascrofulaceum ATCC BAA-614]|uniref:Uncharacterized protein n=1 Tax=Mycobacterium parascrofulaceum ATCC BAA-614 TaxID=525368 RepID=D5P3Q1_9MYCO|nr:hypothetical protein HMPREF0591_0795 [Mycobacterium parascrofulaceum ATCC BAA-614]